MALAVARVGSVIGPAVGGAVVSFGFSITTIFVLAAAAPLISLVAVLGLWLNDHRQVKGRDAVGTLSGTPV
jgi:predicted MFS family arabinose efflux permease